MTIRQVVFSCATWAPKGAQRPKLAQPVQQGGTYPGEDWQMDFTQMPVSQGYIPISYDGYTHRMDWRLSHQDWESWGGGKKLLYEIILRFGLPRSLQSDNGTSFTSKVTRGVSKALGITYYLHFSWRPQSSGKVERAKQFLKSAIKKDNPGDLLGMEGGFTNNSPLNTYCP